MTKSELSYLDGFATAQTVLDYGALSVEEILGSLDSTGEHDPRITPWKRGYNAAIRVAFGR